MLKVLILPVLTDNYIYLIHDPISKETAVVDPALASPVLAILKENNWKLSYVLNTHHHLDHVGGNLELKRHTGCTIIAAQADCGRIPGIDSGVSEGDSITLGRHKANVVFTPGHTSGHIVYHFADDKLLFCGDTLFVMGCGRLFEGTAEQLWHSLQKLKALPGETAVYCTHEYTLTNSLFALAVEPENQQLQQKILKVKQLRLNNQPSVPTRIADELATNPFFREDSPELQASLGMRNNSPIDIFSQLRRMKDNFG